MFYYKGYKVDTSFYCPRFEYQGRWRWFRNLDELQMFIDSLEGVSGKA